MAPHDEEDDPAVYRSGSTKKKGKEPQNGNTTKKAPQSSTSKTKKTNGDPLSDSMSTIDDERDRIHEEPAESPSPGAEAEDGISMQEDADEDDEDESTLLATQPGFNKLLLVLRDERVMRFVKYVSAAAPGSRWDICGEYEVGMVEEDNNDSENDVEDGQGIMGVADNLNN